LALAADLVGRKVDLIIAIATPASRAAKSATNTIPIVFSVGADPVQLGLVNSLSRPESNITGVYSSAVTVTGKRLELLHELIPSAGIIAYLVNPQNAFVAGVETEALRAAGSTLGLELRIMDATNSNEIDVAFATLAKDHPVPLLVSADALFTNQRTQLVVLAARYAIPAIYAYRELAAAGGLRVGIYAGRILRGDKPAELPAQQAVKFEFIINLRTAKAFGITFPPQMLSRADEVIE
jgi:putative ABC transport system substrate-binding protein